MQDAADHPPIIDPRLAAHVAWQIRFDPRPLLITQPVQTASHLLCSLPAQNHQAIHRSIFLLGFDPS
jgi:hypothetical protein